MPCTLGLRIVIVRYAETATVFKLSVLSGYDERKELIYI